ncbi:MAG: MotA/TolQ/ExbB proton channel family protein, partial [Elusimicrobiota bacterium]
MNQTLGGSHFSLLSMIAQGWPVLSVLLGYSILSLAVMWDRWMAFHRASKGSAAFVRQVNVKICLANDSRGKERLAQHEISRWITPLEARLPILGTIASTAPFIGLLGTVIGIIRAFKAVSVSLGGGPSVVANGIAEALITTAFGIM